MKTMMLAAARFARAAHAGQLRKDGSTEYIKHPLAVGRMLWNAGHRSPELICAAFLHDVVEDCGIEIGQIQWTFGTKVARLVAALTEDKGPPRNVEGYLRAVAQCGEQAQLLKLADFLHNLSDLHRLPADHPAHDSHARKKLLIAKLFQVKSL